MGHVDANVCVFLQRLVCVDDLRDGELVGVSNGRSDRQNLDCLLPALFSKIHNVGRNDMDRLLQHGLAWRLAEGRRGHIERVQRVGLCVQPLGVVL